jgi:hypothetical protein
MQIDGWLAACPGRLRNLLIATGAATLLNTAGLHNQEWGGHVYVCTGPRHPWGQVWPSLRHYG